MLRKWWPVVVAVMLLFTGLNVVIAEEDASPPFPLHTVEGTGGVILVPSAYLVNPGTDGPVGRPAIAAYDAGLGKKRLKTFSVTETLWGRVELGYAYNRLHLGDLKAEIKAAGLPSITTNHVTMHNLNARLLLVKEGAFDTAWMPAITAGLHYKNNEDIRWIDRRLGGALAAIGVDDHDSVDYTLVGTKTITDPLPCPVIVSLCGRLTEGNELGLFGFTDHYMPTLEASAVCLLPNQDWGLPGQLALAAEYRIKRDELTRVPGLIEGEDNWWDVGVAYLLNDNLSVTLGFVDYGNVLNNEVNSGWIASVKWEF